MGVDWTTIQATIGFGLLLSGTVILYYWIKTTRRKKAIRKVLYKQS